MMGVFTVQTLMASSVLSISYISHHHLLSHSLSDYPAKVSILILLAVPE